MPGGAPHDVLQGIRRHSSDLYWRLAAGLPSQALAGRLPVIHRPLDQVRGRRRALNAAAIEAGIVALHAAELSAHRAHHGTMTAGAGPAGATTAAGLATTALPAQGSHAGAAYTCGYTGVRPQSPHPDVIARMQTNSIPSNERRMVGNLHKGAIIEDANLIYHITAAFLVFAGLERTDSSEHIGPVRGADCIRRVVESGRAGGVGRYLR
jgi:hypothetical protein